MQNSATYAEQGNLSPHLEESSSGRSVMRKLSNLMSIRKSSTSSSNGSRRSTSRSESFFYCSHTGPKTDERTVEVQSEITQEGCRDPEDDHDGRKVEIHESGF